MFLLPDKTAFRYLRVKKSADCRYGVVSQCLQAQQASKMNPQYISNVCMKFNSKLGGTTHRVGNTPMGHFKVPTMVLGADVSHASPGSNQPSTAAFTVSIDSKLTIRDALPCFANELFTLTEAAARYAAVVQTNGVRVEMIQEPTIRSNLLPLVGGWIQNPNLGGGKGPVDILYFRDGVSEGQYAQVIDQEVRVMRKLFSEKMPQWKVGRPHPPKIHHKERKLTSPVSQA